MKISDLEIYISAAHYLSFTEVAHQLNMTQPGVSRTIKNIEQKIGSELFDRSGHTLALTQAGEIFLQSSRAIIEQYQSAVTQLDGDYQHVNGTIKLRCMNFVMNLLAEGFIPGFLERYPEIQIKHKSLIYHDPTDHEYDGISLCIHKPNDQRMVAQRVFTYQNNYYASPSYIVKYGVPQSPAEFNQHRFLVCSPTKHLSEKWTYPETSQTVILPKANHFETNSLQVAATLCLNGSGIARLPYFFAKKHLDSNDFTPVFSQDSGDTGHLYAIYKHQKTQPYRIKLLLREISLFFAQIEQENKKRR